MSSILLNTDSYKLSHYLQYPPGTEYVSSYIEARSSKFYNFTQFAGLQIFLKDLRVPTLQEVNRGYIISQAHGVPFNRQGWLDIVNLGYYPIRIQAVKEGTKLPVGNALVQIINTDPRFGWLVSYFETAMLRAVWYATTVATRSRFIKNIIREYLEKSATSTAGLDFMLHDFGARGCSSEETAGIGGLAHLTNFQGSDTLSGILVAMDYYSEGMAGFSVPAAEHSTITSWGRDGETDAYENMINQFSKPGAIYSIVSDSYDIFNAVSNIFGDKLKVKVQESGGRLVVRPDSGNPSEVVLKVVELLDKAFGCVVNVKGYRVLPDYVRVLQGDGINEVSIREILDTLTLAGYSAENVVFGMGGELLQTVNRDTLGFAMKTNAIKASGDTWRDVVKDPITDSGKRSKAGRQALVYDKANGYQTVREDQLAGRENLLETIYVDGKLLRDQTLSEVRGLADAT